MVDTIAVSADTITETAGFKWTEGDQIPVAPKKRRGRPKGSLTKLKAKIAAIANEENDNEQ